MLPIANEKLILGDIWLETLNTHLVNYKQKFITIIHQLVTLQGEINLAPKQPQLHQFKRVQTTNEILALFMLQIQT